MIQTEREQLVAEIKRLKEQIENQKDTIRCLVDQLTSKDAALRKIKAVCSLATEFAIATEFQWDPAQEIK
jgi:hypothetical protein